MLPTKSSINWTRCHKDCYFFAADFTSDNSTAVEGGNLWSILKVDDTDNQIQFINQATGEFLYADELMRNPERRRVFTWKNLSTTPVTDLGYWDQTADWIIEEEDLGFTLKNVRYDEYLYSAADDLALSKRQRSVFTWKNYDTLGFEGYWKFNEDMRGNRCSLLCVCPDALRNKSPNICKMAQKGQNVHVARVRPKVELSLKTTQFRCRLSKVDQKVSNLPIRSHCVCFRNTYYTH